MHAFSFFLLEIRIISVHWMIYFAKLALLLLHVFSVIIWQAKISMEKTIPNDRLENIFNFNSTKNLVSMLCSW